MYHTALLICGLICLTQGAPGGVVRMNAPRTPKPCVAPPLFQGQVTRLMPGMGVVTASLSYDATDERLRVLETFIGEQTSTLDILVLYKQGVVYTKNVKKGTCVKSVPPTKFPTLQVPANSTYLQRIYLGGPEKIYLDTWQTMVKAPTPFVLTTSWSSACWPMSQTSIGKGFQFDQISYFNLTLGIKDPSVWDVPAGCHQGQVPMPRIFNL